MDKNYALKDTVKQAAIKETDLLTELKKNFDACKLHYEEWTKEAKEDFKFALGDQWSEEERQILKDQARPCLTFNRIRPIINIVSGYERDNGSRIKVNPEGGEDQIFSEVMDRGIKYCDKITHLDYKMGYWFDDGLYCGKGYLEAVLDYDKDPILGDIKIKQRSPYQILVDPDCTEYDLNEGANYVFKIVRLSKSKIKEIYPGKSSLIDGFVKDDDDAITNGSGALADEGIPKPMDDNYGSDKMSRNYQKVNTNPDDTGDGKFTVKEYWHRKKVKKYFIIDVETGSPKRFDKKDEAESFQKGQGSGKIIERTVSEMWVAAYCAGHLLQDEISPFEPYYSGYPFFRFLGDWAPNSENERDRVQGMVRPLKDPQREKNKSKSQYLHIVNTQANSGWIGDEDAMSDANWKRLEQMGSKPGITIRKKTGKELREILPKGPNNAHLTREQEADAEFKQISTVNPDLMGLQEGTASGRAISMRIKQAVLSLARLFANYRYSKEIIGVFLLEMMPAVFDVNKLKKVIGPQYMAKATDKTKYPEGLSDGHLQAFLQMIDDNKYDVYVSESDQNSTIRYEIFQELSELLKAGAPIPIELLVDYMDLPNSNEVKEKIKEYEEKQVALAKATKKTA